MVAGDAPVPCLRGRAAVVTVPGNQLHPRTITSTSCRPPLRSAPGVPPLQSNAVARVDIALATFDGARFLPEQLDSILAQSHEQWRLLVRDDGSSDGTPDLLEEYRREHPERIRLLRDGDGTLGHARNFARLLTHCEGSYVALCDQDDVWLPHKLEAGLAELRRLEGADRQPTPALVFSDAVVVDADGRTIAPSFRAHTRTDPDDATRLGRLLYANVVPAHTVLFNAALRDVAVPVPAPAPYADWWIALVAAAVGRTAFLPEPTVLHRQHGGNAAGARPPLAVSPRSGLAYLRRRRSTATERTQRFEQARALRARVGDRLGPRDSAALSAFLSLPDLGIVERVRRAHRHDLLPRDVVRSALFVWTAPAWPGERHERSTLAGERSADR